MEVLRSRQRAAALALAAVLALSACSGNEPETTPDSSAPSSSPTGNPPPRELFGADAAKLFIMDLASTDIGEIAEPFNFHDIVMSPDATQVVFMVDAAAPGRPSDNPKDPILFRAPYNDPGAAIALGEGNEPVFSPDGTLVAAVRKDEVVVFNVGGAAEAAPKPKVVLERGDWSIVGWTAPVEGGNSPRIVAQNGKVIWIADPGSDTLPTPAVRSVSPALAVSPTEPLILTGGLSPSLVALHGGKETKFPFDGAELTSAEWNPDGSTVVARSGEGAESKLLSISVTGEATEIQGAEYIGEDIIWMTPTGGYFLYEKINPSKRSDLMQCNPSLQCQNVVSILEAVTILGLR